MSETQLATLAPIVTAARITKMVCKLLILQGVLIMCLASQFWQVGMEIAPFKGEDEPCGPQDDF